MEESITEKNNYVRRCLMNSEAPIKTEFLDISNKKDNNAKLDKDKTINAENANIETKKRSRGMFKSEERSKNLSCISKYGEDEYICSNIATIGECNSDLPSNCNKNHNLEAYIREKKEDRERRILEIETDQMKYFINKECPLFEKYGMCYFGLNCEFALNSHFDECNMSNINSKGERVTSEMLSSFYNEFEFNRTKYNIKNNLRKKLISYPKTNEFLSTISDNLDTLSLRNKNKQRPSDKRDKYGANLQNPLLSSLITGEIKDKDNIEISDNDKSQLDNLKIEKNFLTKCIEIHNVEKEKTKYKKKEIFKNKLILAPLTTVGNLPFRRLCTKYGADVTVTEMVLCNEILSGKTSELALLKRSPDEKCFGIQLACGNKSTLIKTGEFINDNYEFDFIDINAACPVKSLHEKGAGSVLIDREGELELMIKGLKYVLNKDKLVTVKLRMGHSGSPINKSLYKDNFVDECENWPIIYKDMKTHKIMSILSNSGVDAVTIHGRTSFQRYTKKADWDYINYCSLLCNRQYYTNYGDECSNTSTYTNIIGCGDILNYWDYQERMRNCVVDSIMIGRGALLKPWIFTEIRDNRNWDISSNERFDILKQFVDFGLEHWGSDKRGVALTRRFLLEFLSFYHRYIPIGILEQPIHSQSFNWRIPKYIGRNDLETLLSSHKSEDWVRISEMLLGKVPPEFVFIPKHKASSY